MTKLQTIVAARVAELELKPVAAATAVGLERGFIRDIIVGRKKSVSSDKLPLLARALQLDPEALARGEAQPEATAQANARPSDVALPARNAMSRDIPVMGTTAASYNGKGAFQITPDAIDYVARAPGIASARDIYALYVEGESMEPRFFAGDLVYVSPHVPVRINDVVVIQEPDSDNGQPKAFIKVLVRRTAERIVTRQYNPDTTIEFVVRPGITLHKVLGNNELYGV